MLTFYCSRHLFFLICLALVILSIMKCNLFNILKLIFSRVILNWKLLQAGKMCISVLNQNPDLILGLSFEAPKSGSAKAWGSSFSASMDFSQQRILGKNSQLCYYRFNYISASTWVTFKIFTWCSSLQVEGPSSSLLHQDSLLKNVLQGHVLQVLKNMLQILRGRAKSWVLPSKYVWTHAKGALPWEVSHPILSHGVQSRGKRVGKAYSISQHQLTKLFLFLHSFYGKKTLFLWRI